MGLMSTGLPGKDRKGRSWHELALGPLVVG